MEDCFVAGEELIIAITASAALKDPIGKLLSPVASAVGQTLGDL